MCMCVCLYVCVDLRLSEQTNYLSLVEEKFHIKQAQITLTSTHLRFLGFSLRKSNPEILEHNNFWFCWGITLNNVYLNLV